MLRKSPFPIKESRGKHGCLICGPNQIWVGIDKRSRIGPEAGKLGSGPKVPAFDSCSRTGFDRKQLPWIFQRDSRPYGFNATPPKVQRPKNKGKDLSYFLKVKSDILLTTDILLILDIFLKSDILLKLNICSNQTFCLSRTFCLHWAYL